MEIINKDKFARIMANNGNKTICSCKEYLDLALDTFLDLLQEGAIIKFYGLFDARPAKVKQYETWDIRTKKKHTLPERNYIKVKISKNLQEQFNATYKKEDEK